MRDGMPVAIGSRALDLLIALIERPGEIVDKRELMSTVWPDITVDEGSVRWHLSALRKALGDGRNGARYIANQFGRGYSFVAAVRREQINAGTIGPPVPAGAAPHALPHVPSELIGREDDLRSLCRLLMRSRFTTILGSAGIGKTSLAVAAAHQMADEFNGKALFIDLTAITDSLLVPTAVASALNLSVPTHDPTPLVLARLAKERLLLVLDNCEHVIEGASRLAEQLHWDASDVHLLATSREALNVEGEHIHRLDGLHYPESPDDETAQSLLRFSAVQLFVKRLAAHDNGHASTDADLRIIAEMCRKLDGSALAIELAAGRVPAYGLHQTARLLGERFSLFWPGRRTARPRQQTMQATLDWSFALLSPREQTALRWLSIFVGPFSLGAAIVLLSGVHQSREDIHASLEGLAAKSLLSLEDAEGGPEYRLLEITRAYALVSLRESGDFHRCAARHAAYVLDKIRGRNAHREPDEPVHIEHQISNVRAALEWSLGPQGDSGVGVALAAASSSFLLEQSLLVECRQWCERGIAALNDTAPLLDMETELQTCLGLSTMFTHGNTQEARNALNRALHLAGILNSCRDQLRVIGMLQIFHERIGECHESLLWAQRALTVAAETGEDEALGIAFSLLGISYHLLGDQHRASTYFQDSLRLCPPSTTIWTTFWGFDHRNRSGVGLARTFWLMGQPDRALAVAEATIHEALGLSHPVTYCIALIWAVSVHSWRGEFTQAGRRIEVFRELAEIHGLGPYRALANGLQGELMTRGEDVEGGLALLRDALARLRMVRYELLTSTFTITIVAGLLRVGRYGEASDLIDAAIAHSREGGDTFALPELLRLKGTILRQRLDPAAAELVLMDAIALSQKQGALGWELRCARDLADLWDDLGRSSEALALLAAVRARFAEGFGTLDLQETDRILRRLSATT